MNSKKAGEIFGDLMEEHCADAANTLGDILGRVPFEGAEPLVLSTLLQALIERGQTAEQLSATVLELGKVLERMRDSVDARKEELHG